MAPFKTFIASLIVALAMVGSVAAQSTDRDQYTPNSAEFAAQTFTFRHIENYQHFGIDHKFEIIWGSAPATASISVNGLMRGGVSTALFTGVAGTTNKVLETFGGYDMFDVIVTWTGSPSSVKLNISGFMSFLTNNAGLATYNGMAQIALNAASASIAQCGVNANLCSSAPYLYNGVSFDVNFYCPNVTPISAVASTTTQIVALSGTTKIRICGASLNPSTITAGSVDIVYGTGANCATGLTTLTGAYTLPASAVIAIPIVPATSGPLITPAGQAVCVRTVTSTVNGYISWAQY